MRNVGGNSEIYTQVLSEFLNENSETLSNLTSAINEKRYEEAAQILHKIRGSLGSIGAGEVYEVINSLHKALQQEDENKIVLLKEKFYLLFGQLLEEIVRYI